MLVVGIKGDILGPKLGLVKKRKLDHGLVESLMERRLATLEDTLLKCLADNTLKCQSNPSLLVRYQQKYSYQLTGEIFCNNTKGTLQSSL